MRYYMFVSISARPNSSAVYYLQKVEGIWNWTQDRSLAFASTSKRDFAETALRSFKSLGDTQWKGFVVQERK